MPAAIYARISQDRDGEGLGTGRQIEDCEALAARLGLDVIEVINDNDVSAYRPSKFRPGWRRLVDLIEADEIDTVLAYHPDRLYRRYADLEEIIGIVEGHGLTIHTVAAGDIDLSTQSGIMVARMLGAAAAAEVGRKAERQAREKLARAKQGRFNGGRQPLGYEPDGVSIDESRAPALREAVARLLTGHSLASCARYVSEQWGAPVKPRVLRDALIAPRIAGLRQYWSQADRSKWQAQSKKASTRARTPVKMSVVEAEWDGIISVAQWNEVRTLLTAPERTSGQSPRGRSLLGGLLTCGAVREDGTTCGKGMGYSTASYKCMANSGGCGSVSCSTRGIEALIIALTEETLAATEMQIEDREPVRLDTERGRLQGRYDDLVPLWREGVISRTELADQRDVLRAQMERLDAAEDASVRQAIERRASISALGRWEDIAEDTTARAVAIRAVFDAIRILPSVAGKASGPRFDRSRVRLKWAGSDVWVKID
jgi:site-specific DNA recombinase